MFETSTGIQTTRSKADAIANIGPVLRTGSDRSKAAIEKPSNEEQHPSETFPWPTPNDYAHERDAYCNGKIPELMELLKRSKEFTYHGDSNPRFLYQYAEVLSRMLFVQKFMEQRMTDQLTVPLTTTINHMENKRNAAQTKPHYYLEENIVDPLQVDPSESDSLKLGYIDIIINSNGIDDELNRIGVNLAGIQIEKQMVEEMAHVLYILRAEKNPQARREFLEAMREYPLAQNITNQTWETYTNSPIEQDAELWVKQFTTHVYPHDTTPIK